jgi:hypothetical protein
MVGPIDDRSEMLMREMGAALVAWSAVENEWSKIFSLLLFHERRKPPGIPPGDMDPTEEENRANAIWDALNNSSAQLDMVIALAPLVLSKPAQQRGLEYFLKLAARTHDMRGLRNAIAHGPFEFKWKPPLSARMILAGPQELALGSRPHKRLRGKDLHAEVPNIRDQFEELRTAVSILRFWVASGAWIGGDPTSAEKPPSRPKEPKASPKGPDPSGR